MLKRVLERMLLKLSIYDMIFNDMLPNGLFSIKLQQFEISITDM